MKNRALPVFHGELHPDGRLVLAPEEASKRSAHLQWYAPQVGTRRMDVIVKPHSDTRSERANNYYWQCVIEPMVEATGHTDEEIHYVMCDMFLPKESKRIEFFNRHTGEELVVETDGRRSSKLSGTSFYDFVERVRAWALEFLNVETQDPDPEYWRHRKSRAA